ncbi:xylulokinase [Bacillus timonensis]|uniref:xylulokinase n=1 Tax=Bacillus timonensis TaxID=1033734 RepID=UPI00028963BC|nr:xylulokinase [Bacillus timonensis]
MSYLLGIDLGTSSVKTVIMDSYGTIRGSAAAEYDILIPQKNFAEQNPHHWWKATIDTIQNVLNSSQIHGKDIKGIGISGQMHGIVLINKDYEIIRPSIIWSDQRTQVEVDEIYKSLGKEFIGDETLNPLSTGFQIPSLLWVKKHEPFVYNQIYKVLSPKDYIRLMLIGEVGTEITDASATLGFNTKSKVWSEKIITELGLNLDNFPIVMEPTNIAGTITERAAIITGLPKGTPVVFGGGDQFMQAIGNGIIEPGQVSLTIGTGGQVFSVLSEPNYDRRLRTHTFCNAVPGTWSIMGASLSAGLSLSWLNKKVLSGLSYKEINTLANCINPGSEGLLFLPYLTGERTPYMDSSARGTFLGLVLKHERAHLIRAVMEGVVFALRSSVEIIEGLNVKTNKFVASGGGARSETWLKIQAGILNKEIYKSNQIEQAGTGAAIVAGVGVGLYKSIKEACETVIDIGKVPIEPSLKDVHIYNEMYELYKDAYQKNKDLFHSLSKM